MINTIVPDYEPVERNGNNPATGTGECRAAAGGRTPGQRATVPESLPDSSDARDEWLTIAEAARRLGIDPKQVRRYAERLGEDEKTPEGQRPARVRFAPVVRLWQASKLGQMRLEGQSPIFSDTVPSTVTLSVEQVSALYETVIAEKDARIKALEAALSFAQEAARTTMRVLPSDPEQTSHKRPWWRWWRRR